ncbi:MAG TPA: hypothetical protein VFB27_01560 [Opitutaceae bacterium]|nr:hypothetical protein [Opitutaceae bacterium]
MPQHKPNRQKALRINWDWVAIFWVNAITAKSPSRKAEQMPRLEKCRHSGWDKVDRLSYLQGWKTISATKIGYDHKNKISQIRLPLW